AATLMLWLNRLVAEPPARSRIYSESRKGAGRWEVVVAADMTSDIDRHQAEHLVVIATPARADYFAGLTCFSSIFRRTTPPYTLPRESTPTASAPLCSSVVDSRS